jgi:hypothetical protein
VAEFRGVMVMAAKDEDAQKQIKRRTRNETGMSGILL